MVTRGSSARSRRLAAWAPLLLALALSAQARDDYALMEYAPMPALVYQGSMWCALADLEGTRDTSHIS